MLPDDTGKITSAKAVQEAVNNLKTAYAALTSYQKSLLTGPEQQKYKAIVGYMKQHGDDLPKPESYKLNLVVKGDNKESTKILNALYNSLARAILRSRTAAPTAAATTHTQFRLQRHSPSVHTAR